MKAEEYFEKYEFLIFEDVIKGSSKHVMKLIFDLSKEIIPSLSVKENTQSSSELASVYTKLNQKWNDICSLYDIKYGYSPLNKDGLLNHWKLTVPKLNTIL
jgi:hypothetical protein